MSKSYILLFISISIILAYLLFPSDFSGPQMELLGKIHPIRTISPTDTNYTDLAFLYPILENCNIVILGEPTHIEGSINLAKTRLIQFLHQKMNFSVVLFEAGCFEMDQVQKALSQNPYNCNFSLGLWGFWAKANECQNLFSYIRATQITPNPLKIAGFDIQPSGDFTDSARIAQIDRYLKKKNSSLASFPTLKKGLLDYNAVNFWEYRKSKEEIKEIAADLQKMILYCSLYPLPEDSLFIPYFRNISASIAIFNTEERASALRLQKRDSLLAQNVFEFKERFRKGSAKQVYSLYRAEKLSNELQQYKDQKIIIWVANLHALYDNKRYTSKNKKYTFISFGERLKKRYPNQSYTICFTSYLNMEEGRITQKAGRQTWESAIHTKEFPYIFLNFREFPNEKIFNKNMKMRCNQLNNLSANWSQMTDGIFYIDTSHQTTKYE